MTTFDELLNPQQDDHDAFPDEAGPITDSPLTEARLLAVQALFQSMLMEQELKLVKNEFLIAHVRNREADDRLFKSIVEEAESGTEKFVDLIAECLNANWTYDRLGRLEKSILLSACAEFAARPSTPFKVIINEFVTLSKAFLDEKGAKFINGMLNNIAGKLRPNEMVKK